MYRYDLNDPCIVEDYIGDLRSRVRGLTFDEEKVEHYRQALLSEWNA